MNVRSTQILPLSLTLTSTIAALATLTAAPAFEVELWMVELPAATSLQCPESLPNAGRLEVSSTNADAWLKAMGGDQVTSTHLVLALTDAEEFSIELPKIGCCFHGAGTLADGIVHFNVVSVDNPDRPMQDCAVTGPAPSAPVALPGRASARETQVKVAGDHTLLFAPADRGDGRRRLILWRTVAK